MADCVITHHESATAKENVWSPSHLHQHESATANLQTRVELITFPVFVAETATATDSVNVCHLITGNREDISWKAEPVQTTVTEDLAPAASLEFIVEREFNFRTLMRGSLRLHNIRARDIHARVTEVVYNAGWWDRYTLVDEPILGHGFLEVKLVQPTTIRRVPRTGPQRISYHEVTVTNNETVADAYVIALISGWVSKMTSLPADFPGIF